jgi:head-tail adaptor
MKWTPNRMVTIKRKQVTQDPANGADIVDWVPLAYQPGSPAVAAQFHAEVQDVMPSRSEGLRQGIHVSRNATRIRLRWRADIDSSMQVTLHGDSDVIYQVIGGPAEVGGGRKRYIELMCEKYSTA